MMNTPLMSNLHQTTRPWAWQIDPHQATTLPADSAPRWLHVDAGSVWLTRANGEAQADDIWLNAGDNLALPSGSAWVLEGWPQARLSLLLQAPTLPSTRLVSQPARRRFQGAVQAAWRAFSAAPAVR